MNNDVYGLTFHHFGLAVRDATAAIKILTGLGYNCGESVYDPLQKVQLSWCSHSQMPAVELVSPADEPGPLDNILSNQSELVYHICYGAKDISAAVNALKADGIRILPVVPPKPAILFGGKAVGFYHVKGFGLIEIVEET